MKTIFLLLSAALISSQTLAQESASEVADKQVAFYQAGIETGCNDAGRGNGDPAEKVEALCKCMIKVLKEELTYSEWQQAYQFSRNRQVREEMQVIGAHMGKVQSCRTNAL